MIDDPRRTTAYLTAMGATIRPGDRVLEVGTGFGFFAVAAARMGAAHVWAVEPNDAVDLGPRLAAQHGVADRITFLQSPLGSVSLADRCDVLLEDLRGALPINENRLAILRDAHARLLVPGARLVAVRDHLVVALCGARADQLPAAGQVGGIGLEEVRARADLSTSRVRATDLRPLAKPARWATIELADPAHATIAGTTTMEIEADGLCAGLGVWFDAELAGGTGFSSGPESGPTVYDCVWLPLPRELAAERGDRVDITLRAMVDGAAPVWRWDVALRRAATGATETVHASDFAARLMGAPRRARRAASHVPVPDAAGEALAALLALVDGARPLDAIAGALVARYPTRWRDHDEALAWSAKELARLVEDGVV